MEPENLKLLITTFLMSQASYCLLIWMFYDRHVNNKMSRIHERALIIAYKDYASTFEKMLDMDISVTVQQRNLQLLMVEIYKAKYNLSPSFMKQIFEEKEMSYNRRCPNKLRLPKVKTACLGIYIVRFVGKKGMGDTTSRAEKLGFPSCFLKMLHQSP